MSGFWEGFGTVLAIFGVVAIFVAAGIGLMALASLVI